MTDKGIELVYIGFADMRPTEVTKPGCHVVRLSRDSRGRRHRRDLAIKEAAFSYEDRGVGQDGHIAFVCVVRGKYGLMLVFPDNHHQFLPLEIPPEYALWGMDFASDTKTITLFYQKLEKVGGKKLYRNGENYATEEVRWFQGEGNLAQFVRWDRGPLALWDTVPGWLAYAGAKEAYLSDMKGNITTYDILKRRKSRNPPAEARLAALFAQRKFFTVLRQTDPPTNNLPSSFPSQGYQFSDDLRFLYQAAVDTLAEHTKKYHGYYNQRSVLDGVFTAGHDYLWMIARVRLSYLSGLQFINNRGDIRFLCPGTSEVGLGRDNTPPLRRYPPGLFETDGQSGRMRFVPLTHIDGGVVTFDVFNGDTLWGLSQYSSDGVKHLGARLRADPVFRRDGGYSLLLMKRDVA